MSQWMKYYFYVKNLTVVAEDEEGQGLAEYGLIIALVAVVAIAGVSAFGTQISDFLEGLGTQFEF
jgi:pilus assembly protein Flp/PilA